MRRLSHFPAFALLLAVAGLAAALFGAAHNQLSFTVGPDYFHGLKFRQFGIPENMPDRLGAAIVGVRASWWMGVLVGLPAFLYGLFAVPRAAAYFAAGIGAIGLVLLTTVFASGLGLGAGLALSGTGLLDTLPTPAGVDRDAFLRAGLMHEASYLGGALGAVLAFWAMHRAARRDRQLMKEATYAA